MKHGTALGITKDTKRIKHASAPKGRFVSLAGDVKMKRAQI